MLKMRTLLIAGAALVLAGVAALAVQPGTRGTEKSFQESGLRSAVIIQKNNTATAVAGAATLNAAGSGVITSESLTTLVGSDYTLTLTNNMIEAGDVVLASGNLGTSAGGWTMIKAVTPAAGSVVIVVHNASLTNGAAYTGTIQVRFLVVKQNANGSD